MTNVPSISPVSSKPQKLSSTPLEAELLSSPRVHSPQKEPRDFTDVPVRRKAPAAKLHRERFVAGKYPINWDSFK